MQENIKYSPIRQSRAKNLILRKEKGTISKNTLYGRIISIIGKNVEVELFNNDTNESKIVSSIISGTIISKSKYSNLIAVGDNVNLIFTAESYKIVQVENRNTKFSRIDPSNKNREQVLAANIQSIIILASANSPDLNTRLIDRFLIAASVGKITPIIVINKIDIANKKAIYHAMASYKKLGIKVFYISAINEIGIEKVKKQIKNSAIIGQSGVGKSTLINKLLGSEIAVVKEISKRTNKGTHTTAFSRSYNLTPNTTLSNTLIDTPGVREFGLWDINKDELAVLFPDFVAIYPKCKFTSCTHTHEPECAIIDAVEKGDLLEERYLSYLNIFDTLA